MKAMMRAGMALALATVLAVLGATPSQAKIMNLDEVPAGYNAANRANLTKVSDDIVAKIKAGYLDAESVASIRSGLPSTRIVDGVIADPTKREWLVALLLDESDGTYLCGGSYVGHNGGYHMVLTAAHCVVDTLNAAYALFLVNNIQTYSSDSDAYFLTSARYKVVHQDYDSTVFQNDIAYLAFTDSTSVSATPAVLAGKNIELTVGENATVSGYGVTGYGKSDTSYLREVTLQIISNLKCYTLISSGGAPLDSDVEVCAMSSGKGSCQGDSGGPLMVTRSNSTEVVIGIVSWGFDCADTEPAYPDVYTRVSYYEYWIHYYAAHVTGDDYFLTFQDSGVDYIGTVPTSSPSPASRQHVAGPLLLLLMCFVALLF
mmetsp:Transcript_892/g.2070  ORF Transcript_892/g.2070 Transcript_892/m.2070 type:complete len:374 (+) Transcript_892:84-1205(+)